MLCMHEVLFHVSIHILLAHIEKQAFRTLCGVDVVGNGLHL